uniref:CUB domain-containing protein n=1 Tax=Parascaris equorum TaxID=6256 RepID=A0A914S4T3_PAREQ
MKCSFFTEAILEPASSYYDTDLRYQKGCGGHNREGSLDGEIFSPGYPATFPKNVSCNWLIRVNPNKKIYIRLRYLELSPTMGVLFNISCNIFVLCIMSIVDPNKLEIRVISVHNMPNARGHHSTLSTGIVTRRPIYEKMMAARFDYNELSSAPRYRSTAKATKNN